MIALPSPPADLLCGAALFLDFDGTLVEIAPTPDAVSVPDMLGALLGQIGKSLGGGVAIISGRAVGEIRRMLPGAALTVAGSHGQEIARAGRDLVAPPRPAALDLALAQVRTFAAEHDGVLVEDKPLGIGLHYRSAPAVEPAAVAFATALATRHGLHLQRGKMVAELRVAGGGKGEALDVLMREPPFAPMRPVFMGDDLTDEPAFAAAERHGGAGILIGPPRDTAARYRLPSVTAALAWLDAATARQTA